MKLESSTTLLLLLLTVADALTHRKLKEAPPESSVIPGEYLVRYKRKHGGYKASNKIVGVYSSIDSVAMAGVDEDELIEILEDEDVEYVQPVRRRRSFAERKSVVS